MEEEEIKSIELKHSRILAYFNRATWFVLTLFVGVFFGLYRDFIGFELGIILLLVLTALFLYFMDRVDRSLAELEEELKEG